jgi:hypothetical protein
VPLQLGIDWVPGYITIDGGLYYTRVTTKMMMTFITHRGESQGKTKKERKATKSKGRGLEEGG